MKKYGYIVSLHIDLNHKTKAEVDFISRTLAISPSHVVVNKDEKHGSRWILEKEGSDLSEVILHLCHALAGRSDALRELADRFRITIKCGVLYAHHIIAPAFRVSSEAISALSALDLPAVFQIMPCADESEAEGEDEK